MNGLSRRSWTVLLVLSLAALSIPLPGNALRGQEEPASVSPDRAADAAPDTASDRVPDAAPTARVALIPIEGVIYDFTLDSLERRVERARQAGATMIAIELDTLGGQALAALEISKYLKSLDLPTIVWVNNKAYSAGILMAAAADRIVMAPNGSAGDCAPVVPGVELPPTERAKALTPLLSEFQDSARRNGYDFALLHAMCEYGIEVYEIEHITTGERKFVNQVDYRVMVDGVAPEEANRPGLLRQFLPGSSDGTAIMLGVIDATDADRGQWNRVRLFHNGKSLLTLSAVQMVDARLAQSDDIRSRADLEAFLEAGEMVEVNQTWSENLAAWLTSPIVRTVLILVLLVGAYMELQTPGIGLAGGAALIALLLLLAPPMIVGLAEVWHIVAIVLGFVLLMVEIFVLPGFGVAGVAGFVLLIAGLVFMVVPSQGEGPIPLPSPEMWGMVGRSLLSVAFGFILSIVAFIILQRYLGDLPLVNRLVLRSELPAAAAGGAGHTGDATVEAEPMLPIGRGGEVVRIGEVGQAITDLRPVGRAEFHRHIIDVETPGNWIQSGQNVRITDIEGTRVVVELV